MAVPFAAVAFYVVEPDLTNVLDLVVFVEDDMVEVRSRANEITGKLLSP